MNTTNELYYDDAIWKQDKDGRLQLETKPKKQVIKEREEIKKRMKNLSSFITMEHVNQIMQKNLKAKKDCSVVKFKPHTHDVLELPGCWIFLNDGWVYYYIIRNYYDVNAKHNFVICTKTRWYHKVSKKVLEDFKIDFNFSVFDATLAKA